MANGFFSTSFWGNVRDPVSDAKQAWRNQAELHEAYVETEADMLL